MLTGTRPEINAAAGNRSDTIVARFINRASGDPERLAFTLYPMGALQALGSVKWGDWLTAARAASGAFLAKHANAGDRVAIIANNREVWPVAAMAIAMSGLVAVAIPPDGSPDILQAQLSDSGARFVIVDTMARFETLRALQHRLSQPITIICDDLEPQRSSVSEDVIDWETWCRYGAQALENHALLRDRLTQRLDAIRPPDAACITYETESSVGIVRTFETVLADAEALSHVLGLTYADRITCAQPVSQPFHWLLGIGVPIVSGSTVALVEHASKAFEAARNFEGTVFAGSSRAMSRLRDAFATAHSTDKYLRDTACEHVGRHCRLIVTADETCSVALQQDLRTAGVALATVYGTSWQTCICINGPAHFQDDAIGSAFENVALRIADYGELQVGRSAHTAAGSFTRNDLYEMAVSTDGQWQCTGARVERAMSGSFRIVGELNEMLKFSSGRLMVPHPIEASLTALLLVAHAVCDADGMNSLVAVLSLDRRAVVEWALTRGVVAPWEALVEHPLVYQELARGVAAVNAQHEAGERITGFTPTDLEFNVHTGELDDSGGLVRSVIASRFRHVFAELHQHRPS